MGFEVYIKRDEDGKIVDTMRLGYINVLNPKAKFVGDNQLSRDGRVYDTHYYLEQGDPLVRQYVSAEVYQQLAQDLREERWKRHWQPGQYNQDFMDEFPK